MYTRAGIVHRTKAGMGGGGPAELSGHSDHMTSFLK